LSYVLLLFVLMYILHRVGRMRWRQRRRAGAPSVNGVVRSEQRRGGSSGAGARWWAEGGGDGESESDGDGGERAAAMAGAAR
jgi:hypothetical protein